MGVKLAGTGSGRAVGQELWLMLSVTHFYDVITFMICLLFTALSWGQVGPGW